MSKTLQPGPIIQRRCLDHVRSVISSNANLVFFFKPPGLKRFLESLCDLLGRMFSGEVRRLQTPAAKIPIIRYIVNGQTEERLHGTARPQIRCSSKVFQVTQLFFNIFAELGIQFWHLCFCEVFAAWHLISWINSSDHGFKAASLYRLKRDHVLTQVNSYGPGNFNPSRALPNIRSTF